MANKIPNSKPQISAKDVDKILAAKKIDLKKFPVNVVAIRGYYLDTMGAKGTNDRGIFDDCAIVKSPTLYTTVNWNTDPSSYRKGRGTGGSKGMASLKTGVWPYQIGKHKGKGPAGTQAGKVTVIRDGLDGDYADTGMFGINLHWGSAVGTSSLGCQTAPAAQWPSFINPLVAELKRYGQKVFNYILIDVAEMNAIISEDEPVVEAPPVPIHQDDQPAPVVAVPLDRKMPRIGPKAVTVKGIDVSRWQPDFDFANAKANGMEFAFIKASEGTTLKDKSFDRHREKALAAGMMVGAYHFYRPKSDPKAQAKFFCSIIGDLRPGELPPVLDLEAKEGNQSKLATDAKIFCEEVERILGVTPILYTGPYYFKDWVLNNGDKSALVRFPLWIAHYGGNAALTPPPYANWTFWQFTDKLLMPKHKGGLDGNLFNGSLAELRKLAVPAVASEVVDAPVEA